MYFLVSGLSNRINGVSVCVTDSVRSSRPKSTVGERYINSEIAPLVYTVSVFVMYTCKS